MLFPDMKDCITTNQVLAGEQRQGEEQWAYCSYFIFGIFLLLNKQMLEVVGDYIHGCKENDALKGWGWWWISFLYCFFFSVFFFFFFIFTRYLSMKWEVAVN